MTEAGVYVEGLALSFDWDRDGERFLDSAGIDEAIEAFKANPVLAYSHSQRVAETVHGPSRYVRLGVVLDSERTAEGIRIKAWVPRPAHGGFLSNVYDLIRTGAMKGSSIGGRWLKRAGGLLDRIDIREAGSRPGRRGHRGQVDG